MNGVNGVNGVKSMGVWSCFLPIMIVASASLARSEELTLMPHLDLEMTGQEYSQALALRSPVTTDLQPVLDMGKRNLDWLVHINRMRARAPKMQEPISFSNASTQQGFALDSPRIYNPKIIQAQFAVLVDEMPAEMKQVLLDGGPFTDRPPVDEPTYVHFGLRVDRVYQIAARWNLMAPYLGQLAGRRKSDVRGFYFLSKVPHLKEKLEDFSELPESERVELSGWLIGLCFMSESQSYCEKALLQAGEQDHVWAFYRRYLPRAQEVWNDFFVIPAIRSDVVWSANSPQVMTVPFVRPSKPEIADFLKINVEDEFRWRNWRLELNYSTPPSVNTTHIVFEPGTTPHVNRIAGSTITMDANAPLTEYDVQWTIRHEYGHTLGFPDCYLEFYDTDKKQIISYQMDTTNLMCSRRGHLQELHFDQLKKAYFRE
jgi:hypothetical protein